MSDNLTVFGTDYTGVTGIKAKQTGGSNLTYIRPTGTKSISANGTGIDVTSYAAVDVSVPTGTARTSSDLTVSGATITAPAGLYSSAASASVASGTAGTPTATKGTVSNHSVSVTPSVTNTTGYITGGTKTGTAVTVAASELVSGTLTINSSGTKDVTNYASASVEAGGATASATKGAVSNHSVTVTPSVTRTAGWVTAGSANGTAVTVSASELVSGSETKTTNGTYDVTNLASVIVDVDGYTLTTVCEQQTITPDSDRIANPVGSFDCVPGEFYLVTFDGVEYVTSCCLLWDTNHVIGDTRVIWGDSITTMPFCGITTSVTDKAIYCRDTNTHTIKIEHLELDTPAATLTTKTITANGTYNASSDSADGYSSVTVNVSGGGGTPRTSADLTVSGATVTAPAGVYAADASKSVASMTLPTAASATSSGTSKATITPGSSAQYINIPTGYNGTAAYYTISAASGSSKNVQVAQSTDRATTSTYTSVCSLTCSTAGTYDVYWDCFRSSTGGTNGSQLYIGGSAYGSANTTFTNHVQTNHLSNVSIAKNQTVAVYARSRGNNYYAYCGGLTIVQS